MGKLCQHSEKVCLQSVLLAALCGLLVSPLCSPAPAPDAEADPMTGMEIYMGTLMAATLLAKGYLFGALLHGGLVRKSHYGRYGGHGGYRYGRYGAHSHTAVVRREAQSFS